MSRKIICPRCGKIVDVNHDCPNKYKDRRKREQLSSTRWQRIRDEVRRRDVCCVLCWLNGEYNKGEHVHHIIERQTDSSDDNVYNVDKCVFLCENCHHKVHQSEGEWTKYIDMFTKYIEERKRGDTI